MPQVPCIRVQRRESAQPLPQGTSRPRLPSAGRGGQGQSQDHGWRIDRDHLAAVTAAVTPGFGSSTPGPCLAQAWKDPHRRPISRS